MPGIIYAIVHAETGRCYVGQTKKTLAERWRRHVNFAMVGNGQTHIARAIRKYGPKNFSSIELERVDGGDLDEKERQWVAKLLAFDQKSGFNMTPGGDSNPMCVESLRLKVSVALKGRPKPDSARGDNHHMRCNPEAIRKVSEALKGKYVGPLASGWGRKPRPEHVEAFRARMTGRTVSEETRNKLSAQRQGVPLKASHKAAIMAARAVSEAVAANNRRLGDEARARQTGKPITEAHRAAIRASNSTRKVSDETRRKMAESRRAIMMNMTPEERVALARRAAAAAIVANTGRPLSDERKANIAAAKRKKKAA